MEFSCLGDSDIGSADVDGEGRAAEVVAGVVKGGREVRGVWQVVKVRSGWV